METTFDVKSFDIAKFDSILARGLSQGLGNPGQQVCIEAAICETLGLGHSDDPKCVAEAVRRFKIKLNDSRWSSPEVRAKGMRDLGIAQLGTLGAIDEQEFAKRLAEKTIRILIPAIFREVFPTNQACLDAALRCEQEGTQDAANAANAAAYAAYAAANAANAAYAAAYAANAANAAANDAAYDAAYDAANDAAYDAAYDAANAAYAANAAANAANADKYLKMSADLALEVLRELKSPGIVLL